MSNVPPPLGTNPKESSWSPSWAGRLGISVDEEDHYYALTYPANLKEDFIRNFELIIKVYISLLERVSEIDESFEESDGKVRISKTIQLESMLIYKSIFDAEGNYDPQNSPYVNDPGVYFHALKSVVDDFKMSFDALRAIVDRFFYYDPVYSRFMLICPATDEELRVLIAQSSDYSNLPTAIKDGLRYSNFKELCVLNSSAEVNELLISAKVILEQLGEEDSIPNYNLDAILNSLYREFISERAEYNHLAQTPLRKALSDSSFKAAFIQANDEFLSRMFIDSNAEIPTTVYYLAKKGEVVTLSEN